MTPEEELCHRVIDVINGAALESTKNNCRTVLQIGLTISALGLRSMDEESRRRLLPGVGDGIREILIAWAEHARSRPHTKWTQ